MDTMPREAPAVNSGFPPITRLDLVRARTWGLGLPAAPVLPAPEQPPIPAGWEGIEADEPAPSFDEEATDPYIPTPDEEAEALGRGLVLAGEDPEPPAGWPAPRMASFFLGVIDGRMELSRRAADDFEGWLDSLPDPEPDWEAMFPDHDPRHPCEAIEAMGVIEARKG